MKQIGYSMARDIPLNKLRDRTYLELPFDGAWRDSFGLPEQGFNCFIWGGSGNGKTDFTVKLSKYMSGFGRVAYVSAEEGDSKTIHLAINRNEAWCCDMVLGVGYVWSDIQKKLRSRTVKTIIIDSLDVLRLTIDEVNVLRKSKKNVIVVSWCDGNNPRSSVGVATRYLFDVKVYIDRYVAFVQSRYGGCNDFVIWEEKAVESHSFLNRN